MQRRKVTGPESDRVLQMVLIITPRANLSGGFLFWDLCLVLYPLQAARARAKNRTENRRNSRGKLLI